MSMSEEEATRLRAEVVIYRRQFDTVMSIAERLQREVRTLRCNIDAIATASSMMMLLPMPIPPPLPVSHVFNTDTDEDDEEEEEEEDEDGFELPASWRP